MRAETKKVRDTIKHIDGAWARMFKDGVIWAGAGYGNKSGAADVLAALKAAGFRCETNGKPGTSGEYVIDVFLAN